ncbi:PTS galactosamine/N-acetylgalactosamine transporter subunit IIA [Vibrio sp. Hep-1b-8]|uniref:PTS galactosamine/N-acetylgalactosamine transporter subunit IIA n=1 Tax=Vibrio sp. Hep-1b-8 TaxID=2144187 RepID=UPI0011105E09|nr:PTS galactosamine/N-acetylgalactosamine transporter subunit IIA [Vibrio sp. Hep-1b-8]TMX44555.1 PTS N-acetylgalactosamine transporter subunit IIA [Vibrio sp. Hep-1b-8]
MIAVILVGHGHFGSGLGEAVEQVLGPQRKFHKIDFPEGVTVPQLEEKMIASFEKLYNPSGVVFLCDLLGGSPFRVASTIAVKHKNVEVISGTNMQICAELMLERDELELNEFRNLALLAGPRGITSLHTEWLKQKASDKSVNEYGI